MKSSFPGCKAFYLSKEILVMLISSAPAASYAMASWPMARVSFWDGLWCSMIMSFSTEEVTRVDL